VTRQVSGTFISFVHFIRQFGVLAFFFFFFFFFPPLAIYSQKEKSKTKSAKKSKVLFEIFNSHNKKICQISIHGSIRVIKKKNKILKRNFYFHIFLVSRFG
jgi:hypothetical protein